MTNISLAGENQDPIFALAYGASGSGKTHLAGTLGELYRVLVIDIDKGSKTIKFAKDLQKYHGNITVASFDKFGDLDRAYKLTLANDPKQWSQVLGLEISEPFDWVVWDTWSELQWNMLQELRSKDSEMKGSGLNFRKNIQIQHWGQMTDLNKLAIESLRDCKSVNQLFLMQETMSKDDLSGQIFGGPAIHGKMVEEMPTYFDVVIHMGTNISGQFTATTKAKGKWVAKTRLGEGADYINPTAKQVFNL